MAREARRYRNIFCACMEEAVRLLRASQDFPQMRELGNYATSISPLSDWETVTMEALVAMGRYEDARKLYNDTVDFYFRPVPHRVALAVHNHAQHQVHGLAAPLQHPCHHAVDALEHGLIGRQRTGIQYYVNSVICHPHGGSAIVDKGRG